MKLSTAELEIMEQIWRLGGPVTAAALSGALQDKGWKPTTLLTFLARMVQKGALSAQRQGKQNVYSARITSEEYRAGEAREMLSKFYSGSVKSMVAALYQDKALSASELDELHRWLEER